MSLPVDPDDCRASLLRRMALTAGPSLCRTVWSMGVEDPEAVVQEALLRLWRSPSAPIEPEEAARAWLARVAINLARDELRRWGRFGRIHEMLRHAAGVYQWAVDGESSGSVWSGVEDPCLDQGRLDRLRAAILDLPERQRLIAWLRLVEEQSPGEAALAMGLAPGIAESLFGRACRTLKTRLARIEPVVTREGSVLKGSSSCAVPS